TKQQRMRLAQRTYRARKQEAQDRARTQVEKLSRALDDALSTYASLHWRLAGSLQSQDWSGVLSHLNDASARIAGVASSVDKTIALPPSTEGLDSASSRGWGSFASPQDTGDNLPTAVTHSHGRMSPYRRLATPSQPATNAAVAMIIRTTAASPTSVSARISRACFQRVVAVLSGPGAPDSKSTTMAIPLQLLGKEDMLANSLQALSLFQASVADFRYPLHSAARLPRMYRVQQGGARTVSRAATPFLQQIARGGTRTVLDTAFKPLQGEWMEAVDVEEYLEERGICLRTAVGSGGVPATEPMHQATVFEASLVDSLSPQMERGGQVPPLPLSDEFRGHEPADYSVFGISGPGTSLRRAVVPVRRGTDVWANPDDGRRALQSDFGQGDAGAAVEGAQITVDLDRLVYLLAEKAMCLGPVPGIRREAVDVCIRGSIIL
ncbi:hypothetical protein ACHAO3_009230, partial [Verticillium nonalfalfae]